MTQRHLLELLREDHPQKGDVYLRILVNQAMSEFAFETLILRGTGSQAADGSTLEFPLPADCIRLERVYNASDGVEVNHTSDSQWRFLVDGEAGWWADNGNLVIGYHSKSDGQFKATPATYTWDLRYRRYPTTLTTANMDDELDLPTPFHNAIEARMKERLSVGVPDVQRYWFAVWRDFLRKGIKWANENQDGGAFNVNIHDTYLG